MPRLSLRQILVAIFALAAGLAIARLPSGSWFDVPLALLSFYFMVSLWRHAAGTRRMLAQQWKLAREQRWGGRLLALELLAAASALLGALVLSYLSAADVLWITTDAQGFVAGVQCAQPRDLAVLAMLVAIWIGSAQRLPVSGTPTRQKIYATIAVVGALIVVVAYWAAFMLVWYLVYLAVSSVEASARPEFLLAEVKISVLVRMERFMIGSIAGLSAGIVNVVMIGGLVKWWSRRGRRWLMLIVLAAGLAVECWCAVWISGPGLRQLSPSLQESLAVPWLWASVVAVAMLLLAVGALSWRLVSGQAMGSDSRDTLERPLYFHERSLAGLMLGVVAVTHIVTTFVDAVWMGEQRPTEFIWLAAVIGGFTLAWNGVRRRNGPLANGLPTVNPAQFVATAVSLFILTVASAPIVAAASFSYWFMQYRAEYW